MALEIAIRTETTLDDIRRELPLGGDWGLVRDGDEWALWINVDVDGLATLNDWNSEIEVWPDENLHSIATEWIARVA